MSSLKSCHSERSSQIYFNPKTNECNQCSQNSSCELATMRRIAHSQNVNGQKPATQQTPAQPNTAFSMGAILKFDPMPEKYSDGEEESVITRTMKNMFQAGSAAALEESVYMLRHYKWRTKQDRS